MTSAAPTESIIAFGGNAPNTPELFNEAVERLAEQGCHCLELAGLIQSAPMGANAGDTFHNTVGCFESNRPPQELLAMLHRIENDAGRKRSLHWGPRPIDLDLIAHGDKVIDTDQIVVPHPCLWYRSFVVFPLAEVRPNWMHPVLRHTAIELQQMLERRPLEIVLTAPGLHLPLEDIAQKAWGRAGQVCLTEHRESAFAEIIVAGGAPSTTARRQPKLEMSRTIRCPVSGEDVELQVEQFLRDFASAALG